MSPSSLPRVDHPFGDLIGLTPEPSEPGHSRFTLELQKRLMNPHNVVHGAVVYAMADTGMGMALYPLLQPGELCATVEIKIAYMGTAREGTLTCDTHVTHKGRKIAFLESRVARGEQLIATATGTYYIFMPSG